MLEAIGDVLPLAVAIGIFPIPIIAVILLLSSSGARINGPMFLVGWVAGLALVVAVVVFLIEPLEIGGDDDASESVSWARIVLGAALLLMAYRQWAKRPRDGENGGLPGWMARLDSLGPAAALGFGAFLAAGNPKNMIFGAAAAAVLSREALTTGEGLVVLVVYLVVASLAVGTPVVMYLLRGEAARQHLEAFKGWLIANNTTIVVMVLLVFGVFLVGAGIGPAFG